MALGVFLLIATVNDLSRQQGVNERLIADLRTWRAYTGHDYQNLLVDTQLLGPTSKREVVCGNTSPGAPKERTQLCLLIWGPIVDGRRPVHGGWYLPPRSEDVLQPALRLLRAGGAGGTAAGERRRPAAGPGRCPPRRRRRARPLVAAGRADAAGRGAALLDARPAELLVRRGLHGRPGPARGPRLDAALGRPHREHAAALVPDRVGGLARAGRRGRSRCGCSRRSPGSRWYPWPGRSAASSRGGARRPCWRRSSPSTRCSCGTRRRRAHTGCSLFTAALAMLCFLRADRVPDALADGGVRAERGAGAAHPLLRRVPARGHGPVAAADTRRAAAPGRCELGARSCWSGWRCCRCDRPGRARHAVDRPLGARPAACRRSRSTTSRATRARRSGTGSSCSSRCRCSPVS